MGGSGITASNIARNTKWLYINNNFFYLNFNLLAIDNILNINNYSYQN